MPGSQSCFAQQQRLAQGRKRPASAPPGSDPPRKLGAPGVNGNRPGSVPPQRARSQGRYASNVSPGRTPPQLPAVAEQQAAVGATAANPQRAPAEAASTSASGQTSTTTPAPPPAIRHQPGVAQSTWDYVSAEHIGAMKIAKEIISDVRKELSFGSANQAWNFAGSDVRRDEATQRVLFLYQYASLYLRDELQRYIGQWQPARRAAWVDASLAAHAKQLEDKNEPAADSLKQEFRRALTAALDAAGNEAGGAHAPNEAVKSAMDDLRSEVMREKPRLRAVAAQAVKAGNCDQMADLTFMRAREKFKPDYLVQLIGVPGHTFCRVGKRHWQDQDFIVIDPWPLTPYPILAGHHLGYRHMMTLWRSKPGLGVPISDEKQARYGAFRDSIRRAFTDYATNTWARLNPSEWYWRDDYFHNCLYPTPADQSRVVTYYEHPAYTQEEQRAQAVHETLEAVLQAVDGSD
jgi:hypothetical protein